MCDAIWHGAWHCMKGVVIVGCVNGALWYMAWCDVKKTCPEWTSKTQFNAVSCTCSRTSLAKS